MLTAQCSRTLLFQDRNAVLQKAKSLRGSHILISEDFPRDIMKKRRHLIKFAKQVNNPVLCDFVLDVDSYLLYLHRFGGGDLTPD